MANKLNVWRGVFWAATMAAGLAAVGGCSRNFYRQSADREVNDILAEKDKFPEWKIEQMHVYPDQRARFADTSNPDHPPMPPDDDATWRSSPHPQKPGHHVGVGEMWGTGYLEMIKAWDAENRAAAPPPPVVAEVKGGGPPGATKNPIKAYMDETLNDKKKPGFLLTMDQSIELGVVNSPQYQTFREELYLAALPVTQQRFNFAYQWAATADWIRNWAGGQTAGGPLNSWTGSSNIGFTKLFATGALLTTDFANTTAFNFGAGGGLTSVSNINVNLAQPLLQGGGLAVTLEPLTQAERNLFYSVRAYARFREQFAVAIALGSSLPGNLATAAGSGGTGSGPISLLAALGIASTDVSGGFVGYLSTLYRECDLAADQKWAHDLNEFYKIIEAYQEGGFYSPLQVDQARSTLLQAQNAVLTDKQFVTNALDQFKLVLGLPANTPLILDDTPARPVTIAFDRYYEVIADSGAASRRIEEVEKKKLLSAKEMRSFLEKIFTDEADSPIVNGTEFRKKMPDAWAKWRAVKGAAFEDRKEDFTKRRRDLLQLKTDLEIKGKTFTKEDELIQVSFEIDLATLEKTLRAYDAEPWAPFLKQKAADPKAEEQLKETARVKQIEMARGVVQRAKAVLLYPRNERFEKLNYVWPAEFRAALGDLDLVTADVDLAQEEAVKAAMRNRFDLMNARAQVVDAWRQLKVTANALMGVVTPQYTLSAQTGSTSPTGVVNGVRPLVFTPENTSQQISLNFQLPLNRLAQRNAYRTAQINYQASRRALMVLEDSVAAQVRFDVRQLQLFTANYRIQKKVIHSLYKQVDSALDVIVAPTDPDALKGSGTSVQANAAALTSQYLNALQGLNTAQTKMYDIWLSIFATRMQLYMDLERLPLDSRGVWIDNTSPAPAAPAAAASQAQPRRDVVRGVSMAPMDRPVFLQPR